MSEEEGLHDLEDVLEALRRAGEGKDRTSLEDVRNVLGQRAFGPFLLAAGLIAATPVGGIPGVPTFIAVIVLITAVQMLFAPSGLWLPKALLRRSVDRKKLRKSMDILQRPARFIDKILRPRLVVLTRRPARYVIGAVVILMALTMPFLELLPFAGIAPASGIAIFGLALMAHDGVLSAVAFLLTGATFYLLITGLLL